MALEAPMACPIWDLFADTGGTFFRNIGEGIRLYFISYFCRSGMRVNRVDIAGP